MLKNVLKVPKKGMLVYDTQYNRLIEWLVRAFNTLLYILRTNRYYHKKQQ